MVSVISSVSLCDIVANILDCDIVVSEFELQSPYYFLTFTLGKDIKAVIPTPSFELNSTSTFLLQEGLWH